MSGYPVNIDHLSFSAPLSSMALVDSMPNSIKWHNFERMPSPVKHSYVYSQSHNQFVGRPQLEQLPEKPEPMPKYEQKPDIKIVFNAPDDRKGDYAEDYNTRLTICYYSRLLSFIYHVLDFSIGEERGFGQFFYKNSRPLYLKRSNGTELAGMLFYEGNKDTFFIQISGAGCRDLFARVHPVTVHGWINHLGVTQLNRIDLCVDDYTGNFDTTYALKAAYDDFFYGGAGPYPIYGQDCRYDRTGQAVRDIVTVGSRQSKVYWRVYDKSLEQGVTGTWYRSEAELKRVDVDVLLDVAGHFTGLCDFARSINAEPPVRFNKRARQAIDSIESKIKWLRRQCGTSLAQVIEFCFGDVNRALSLVLKTDDAISYGLPPMYQMLVAEKMGQLETMYGEGL